MRSGNGNREEEEYEEEEFSSGKQAPSASAASNNNKDAKYGDKASAIRSKHSVTEQRRRSKINERFQILRDLIPNTDQKRDTASFLLEVIEYVQYLQEKVQKYEASYQGWGPEATKLMPWRNSHWRVQNLIGHPQAIKNGSGPGSLLGKFDENNVSIAPAILTNSQNPLETDPNRDIASKVMEHQPKFANKGMPVPIPASVPGDGGLHPLQRPISDAHSADIPIDSDGMNQQEELTIEGGTISISSAYSHGLLSSLTQALQSTGVDLSQANIHVQIDLGKRANRKLTAGASALKEPQDSPNQAMTHLRDVSIGEDSVQAQKRLKK